MPHVFYHLILFKATSQEALKLRKEVVGQTAALIGGLSSRAGKDTGLPTLTCTMAGSSLPSPQRCADQALVICVSPEGHRAHVKLSLNTKSVSDSE